MKVLVTGGTNGMGKGVAKILSASNNQIHEITLKIARNERGIHQVYVATKRQLKSRRNSAAYNGAGAAPASHGFAQRHPAADGAKTIKMIPVRRCGLAARRRWKNSSRWPEPYTHAHVRYRTPNPPRRRKRRLPGPCRPRA